MPNCFQLIDKVSGVPATFCSIDDRLCADLGVTPDPKLYYMGWYDIIGIRLATGSDWDKIEAEFSVAHDEWEDKIRQVIQWMRERYDSTAWYERRQRNDS
jgi:hypothetical protein